MWYLILALVLVILLLLSAPVTVHIRYVLQERDDQVPNTSIVFATPGTGVSMSFLWGLLKLRLRLSTLKLVISRFAPEFKLRARLAKRSGDVLAREKTSISAGRVLDIYKQVMNVYRATEPAYRYMLSTIKLHRFGWCTRIGMWQADQTGIAVGLLWAIKSNSTAYLYRRFKKPLPKPELEIIPVFDARVIATHFNCMFSFRAGHLIVAGVMATWLYLKNRKNLMHNRDHRG